VTAGPSGELLRESAARGIPQGAIERVADGRLVVDDQDPHC
jgi:hypothetical protein